MPEDDDPEEVMKKLQKLMNKCLEKSRPVEELEKVVDKAAIMKDFFDLHFRDEFGYTLLGNAVQKHEIDVVKYLVEQHKFKIKEELLIAVQLDYKPCVDYLLKKHPYLVNRKVLAGTTFRPGQSPVMIASLMENDSMLKFLFARGAKPLEVPEFDPSDPNNIIRFDAIYQTLLALSKPMYLCVMNEDPIMVAFKIAEKCEELASALDVAKDDLMEIKKSCEKFAADFIKFVPTFDDLELVLGQMTTDDVNLVVPGTPWERLSYAMNHNHVDFVASGSVQKLMKKKFMDGPLALNDFESANVAKKTLFILALSLLTPVWLFLFLVFPISDSATSKFIKSWLDMPFMIFIAQSVLYFALLVVVIDASVQTAIFPMLTWPVLAAERICLQELLLNRTDCITNNLAYTETQKASYIASPNAYALYLESQAVDFISVTLTNTTSNYISEGYISVFTLGNIYKELLNIWAEGIYVYSSDWVNVLNILSNWCFINGIAVKYTYVFVDGYSGIGTFGGEIAHPLQIFDAFTSVGLLLLFYKMYKLLRVTETVGRQQILLREAFIACFYFFILFFCVLFAFSVASNSIIWRSYRAYIQNCRKIDGKYETTIPTNIPCETNLVPSSLEELVKYQDFFQVLETFFFGMFLPSADILSLFPSYENMQEWTLAIMYGAYVFLMIIVRMNVLISLVIFAVKNTAKFEATLCKFQKAKLMYLYICGADPMPPPFNLIPSVSRISSWARSRNKGIKLKMLSEEELNQIPRLRALICKLKLSYLREQRKSLVAKDVDLSQLIIFKETVQSRLSGAIDGVKSINTRAEKFFKAKAANRRALDVAEDDKKKSSAKKEEEKNPFTRKYNEIKSRKNKYFENKGGGNSRLGSFFK
ncbi:transient-receptor-potential-like protein [Symsagittifera roscoffensis]|uniref:transient-receptor-potential-like protein n=1 Tax=Symsagittifera roscoffensis TaxID=84072 RepID=UPI00307C9E02